MKVNYIRITASAIVLLANALCGNTKVTEATPNNSNNGIMVHRITSSPNPKIYKPENTILPVKARISIP